MNVRDPFDLRRSPKSALHILRATATAASEIRQKAVEVGSQAIEKGLHAVEDMSFAVPKNVPSFGNPQRKVEDYMWQASSRRAGAVGGQYQSSVLGGVQNRVGGLLNPDRNAIPMYKDKPYAYAPSGRPRPLYRRKSFLGFVFLLVIGCLWWFGISAEHQERAVAALNRWPWVTSDAKAESRADWLKRRERVTEAFELSWDAYARHAWGKVIPNIRRGAPFPVLAASS
jgi:mannosyl-oligosaccharide alpha-1,2-mannosidase